MTTQKQRFPSFASTISVLGIVLYCAGFLRVELELNDQKKRELTLLKTSRRLNNRPMSTLLVSLLSLQLEMARNSMQFKVILPKELLYVLS